MPRIEVSRKPFDDAKAHLQMLYPNLTEPELHRMLREKLENDYLSKLEDRRARLSDKVLLRVLELIDTHGVSKRAIGALTKISTQEIFMLITGKTRVKLRDARCAALGIRPEEYSDHCKRMSKKRRQNEKTCKNTPDC